MGNDLISRKDLLEAIISKYEDKSIYESGGVIGLINSAPAIQHCGDGEPVEYQRRTKAKWVEYWNAWECCSKGAYEDCKKVPVDSDWQYEVRELYVVSGRR